MGDRFFSPWSPKLVRLRAMDDATRPRLDRGHFSVASLDEAEDEHYCWSKTPDERLAALEVMRQSMNGYDPARTRLQKILIIATLGEGDGVWFRQPVIIQ